jgi:hypothetical protein
LISCWYQIEKEKKKPEKPRSLGGKEIGSGTYIQGRAEQDRLSPLPTLKWIPVGSMWFLLKCKSPKKRGIIIVYINGSIIRRRN